jgi:hypothetical protein
MALTQEDRNEILQIAADAFVKANKRSRNDVGRGDPELGQILQKAIAKPGNLLEKFRGLSVSTRHSWGR